MRTLAQKSATSSWMISVYKSIVIIFNKHIMNISLAERNFKALENTAGSPALKMIFETIPLVSE
jgi:hypothetical protein